MSHGLTWTLQELYDLLGPTQLWPPSVLNGENQKQGEEEILGLKQMVQHQSTKKTEKLLKKGQ